MRDDTTRQRFRHYLQPTAEEFGALLDHAFFVFDTNVFLNAYQWERASFRRFTKLLHQLRDRVWIPNHVAWEFYKNRPKAIADLSSSFRQLIRDAENLARSGSLTGSGRTRRSISVTRP